MSKYIGTPVVNISADTVDVTGDITTTDATPEVTIVNNTHEDTDGGREGKVTFKGQQSGGEETTLAEIQASHDGTSDDEKGDLIFKTNDGSDGASPTERLRIDSTGNVGVSGSTKTTALSSAAHFDTLGLSVDDNTAYDNVGVGGGIAFRGKRNSSGVQTVFGAIDVGKESAANDSYVGSLRFYTNNNSTGIPTEHMRIDSSGKVRVGGNTATMSNSLTVEGASYTLFGMKRNTGVTTGTGEFAMHMETNSQTTISYDDEGSIAFGTAGTPSTAAGFSEKMRIDSSGNLLVGTTSVQGAGGTTISSGPQINLVTANANLAQVVQFRNSNGKIGTISISGSSTAYNTSSDYRLKENVTDVTDGITRVKQLSPKRFNFIVDADTTVDGFLAHEAQAVVPEAVTGTKDAMKDEEYTVTAAKGDVYTPATDDADEVVHSSNVEQPETLEDGKQWRETEKAVMGTRSVPDMQGIDQAKLVPLLTAALQEAIAKIETLESENTAIKARLDALEAE